MKLIFALVFIFSFFTVDAQYPRSFTDSISQQLRICKSDTAKLKILFDASYKYPETNKDPDPNQTLFYAQQALSLADSIGYKKGIADAYNAVGCAWLHKHKNKRALEYYYISERLDSEINDKVDLGGLLCNMGNVYSAQYKYKMALQTYNKAKKILEETNNKFFLAITLQNIGRTYASLHDFINANENYSASLILSQQIDKKHLSTRTYLRLAFLYKIYGRYAEAAEFANKALSIAETGKYDGNTSDISDINKCLKKIQKKLGT